MDRMQRCGPLRTFLSHSPPLHTAALSPQGVDLTDEELVDHISEMCVMSKSLEEYEGEALGRGSVLVQ